MPDAQMPRLVVISPPELADTVLPLPGGETVIGCEDGADVVFNEKLVSRRHALITIDSAGIATIEDLESTTGTFVNGEPIEEPRALSHGDLLRLGDIEFRFEPAAPAPATATKKEGKRRPGTQPSAEPARIRYVVNGTVSSPTSASVGGLDLRLVDKDVGKDKILARGRTQPDGRFALDASLSRSALAARHKTAPDLQVQVVRDGAVVAASIVRYNATSAEELDVVLPARAPLASEHEALTAALAALYPGSLVDLEESEQRQDITYLANKSGWDARAVAMASLAAELSGAVASGNGHGRAVHPLSNPAYYYALLRAGLPSESVPLHQTDPDAVVSIWKQSADNGVIPKALGDDTAAARAAFVTVAARQALTAPPLAGPSTLGELLGVTLGNDTARQQQFADLLVRYRNDTTGLWTATEKAFGASTSAQLQLLGQLAFLTANNAPLLEALYQAQHQKPLGSPLDLVKAGYFEASAWTGLMANVDPPPEIPGSTPQEQKANYAELLAAQIRVSFPTATVGQLAASGRFGPAVEATGAGAFLLAHADFDIGDEPIGRYLSRTGTTADADAVNAITRMQRVYQIAPDATAMTALLAAGLDSAYAITRLRQASFVEAHADALGGEQTAQTVYARARAVHASTLHLALSYLSARRQPLIGSGVLGSLVDYVPSRPAASSNGHGAPAAATHADVSRPEAQATLESLFGDLDYCQCSDCQSITSPAAYLVDLLDWINNPTPHGTVNPRTALLERRPDIGALPLTCENTNIALPYIDLVNEILEYYVGNPAPESLTSFTGYNEDGKISSAELVASPQNDDNAVARNAYDILKAQWFPPPLPFYRDLELMRRHIARFGIGLYDVMRELRTSEQLESPAPADPHSYGWRDILAERLGLSRLEYRLLTDSTLTLAQIYGYPSGTPATGPGGVIASVSPLQEFSRRTGVAYDDVVSILRTRFINPGAWLIDLLDAIALPFSTLKALHDGTLTAAQFTAELPAGLDTADYGPSGVAAWVITNFDTIAQLIVVDTAGAPCDTSAMTLQYLDGTSLAEIDLVRLMRFIRLWRKLGLSIQQTDELISALYESAAPPPASPLAQLDSGFLTLLPRIGLAYMATDLLGLDPSADLDSLLVCWARIGTGPSSLYARLFLNPTVLLDPVFAPDAGGNLFSGAPAPTLLAHQPAICAALNLTEGEFALITGPAPLGLGYDAATALTLEALSAIFRRAWLARALQLSVLELLSLIVATAVDPFAAPVLAAASPVSAPLLDFARRVQALRNANLAPVQALYLLWNEDLSGVSAPSDDLVMGLATSLRAAFVAIDAQFAVTNAVTATTAKSLMSLVLGATAADLFFGLVNNTFMTSVAFGYTHSTLPAAVITASGGRLGYDDLAKLLSFGGYLDATTLAAMQAAAAGDATLLNGLTALAAANTSAVDAFFAAYDDPLSPYLKPLFDAYVASAAGHDAAVATLLAGLLPLLADRRKREQALACASTAVGSDPSFGPPLLGDAAAVPAVNPASPGAAGVSDLTALGQGGLSVQFFLTNDPAAAPDQTLAAAPSLTYGANNPLPAPSAGAGAIAARWTGFISATQDGDYNLSFAVDTGATVTELTVGGRAVPVSSVTTGALTVWSNTSAIALRAGALTPIQITATGLTQAFAASWETLGSGWQQIPAQSLYSNVLIGYLRTTTLRFLKATALATDLSLTGAEIAYLATSAGLDVAGRGWLAGLAVDAPAAAANFTALTAVLDGVLAFATLKARYSPLSTQTPQLLRTLKDIAASAPTATGELLALTGWDGPSLSTLLPRLFDGAVSLASLTAAPGILANVVRLQSAYALVSTCRLSAATLIEAATNDPTPTPPSVPASTVLADLQSAVRSRYAEADWLKVVKPINDSMRELQRDALVSYILAVSGPAILAALGIAATPNRLPTADDLFNYFLLDVEMEPCMETSRIRLALSSVQLFIERSLRNLEPGVDPADIDPDGEWNWRKRYRVWQANREVFLWPENWLDPTLRDDQSPFFKTTMSRLLQSDITDDAAAEAYLDYLSNLEAVAKLDPCGLYYQPPPPGSADDEAHVIARTGGAHRKHYHRRLAGGAWTPWEEIKLSIEDNPVFPYVWNGRLMLFWLQVQHRSSNSAASIRDSLPHTPAGSTQTLANAQVTDLSNSVAVSAPALTNEQVGVVLSFSEYYNGAWQPVKTSNVAAPVDIGPYPQGTFNRSELWLLPFRAGDANDESLYLQVLYGSRIVPAPPPFIFGFGASTLHGYGFVVHNTHSAPVSWSDVPPTWLASPSQVRELYSDGTPSRALTAVYGNKSEVIFGFGSTQTILTSGLPQAIENAQPDVGDQSFMPFFFGDARNAFYVTSSVHWIWLGGFDGFGITPWQARAPGETTISIPPIIVREGPPQPGAPIQIADNVITPSVARTAVAADGFRAVLGGGATVNFRGRQVGITGGLDTPSRPPTTSSQ